MSRAENDGDELTVKLKDVRKEVERGKLCLSTQRLFSSCQPFCLGMRRSPARVVALWRYHSYFCV